MKNMFYNVVISKTKCQVSHMTALVFRTSILKKDQRLVYLYFYKKMPGMQSIYISPNFSSGQENLYSRGFTSGA